MVTQHERSEGKFKQVLLHPLLAPWSSSSSYLDGKEGDVGELLHEASNLLPALPVVHQPGPALDFHLPRQERLSGLQLPPCLCLQPLARPQGPGTPPGLLSLSVPASLPYPAPTRPWGWDPCLTFWLRESTNHSSPMKLQAMSTSPLYSRIRYF